MVKAQFKNIDLSYLHLMSDGDTETEQTILAMLVDEIPTEIALMRKATDEQNWLVLREVSHKMKSTLAFVGNPAMTEANQEIELLCKTNPNEARIKELMPVMEKNLPLILEELKGCVLV